MNNDIEKILVTEEELKNKIVEIGKQISNDYKDKNPIIVGVLRGSFIFMADLVREINIPVTIDFMAVSSYRGTTSTGKIKIEKDLSEDVKDRNVILIEDILDTGRTLSYIIKMLENRGAKSVNVCSLLVKKARTEIEVDYKYSGFNIPNEFVVGYGLDYEEKYRNLKYIGVLKEKIYSKIN